MRRRSRDLYGLLAKTSRWQQQTEGYHSEGLCDRQWYGYARHSGWLLKELHSAANTVRALVQSYAFQEQPSNSYAKAVGALVFARREEIRSDSRTCRACVDTGRNKVGRQIIIRVPPATWNLECLNLPSPLSLLATNVPQPALHHYRRWLAPVPRGLHGPRPLIRN